MATVLINSLPSKSIHGNMPIERLTNKKVDLSNFCIFGCMCFPYLRHYNNHKFDFKSEKCVYLGPSPAHKGFKCLIATGKIYITRHVIFHEEDFPFKTGFGQPSPSISTPTPFIIQPGMWIQHSNITTPTPISVPHSNSSSTLSPNNHHIPSSLHMSLEPTSPINSNPAHINTSPSPQSPVFPHHSSPTTSSQQFSPPVNLSPLHPIFPPILSPCPTATLSTNSPSSSL